ncbi:MAG: DNA-protecting protein DprA [Chitinophagales bacterium]|nr:DNA-protecting protein DprA [Chitinophagales bacterium]
MDKSTEQFYTLALSATHLIGAKLARDLIEFFGSASEVFNQPKKMLIKVKGINENIATHILSKETLLLAEKEIQFISNNNIHMLLLNDDEFPSRLKHCYDTPTYLFTRGNANFNVNKIVSVIGTRNATNYGKELTIQLVQKLATLGVTVVSGLAYGIDIVAHKVALESNIPTIAVLAHGLDMIYPYEHKKYINTMLENGAIVSEFFSNTLPDKHNFPRRNRIVAGLSDATIVVESAIKGGALITARLAHSYNREVMAFPGDVNNKFSKGCHHLIQKNMAALVENADDIIQLLNWNQPKENNNQTKLFVELSAEEQLVYNCLSKNKSLHIDKLSRAVTLSNHQLSPILFNLELAGLIQMLPGSTYSCI